MGLQSLSKRMTSGSFLTALWVFSVILAGGPAWAGQLGECHFNPGWVYEVAAPRAAILSDTVGDGDNFDQGDDNGECGPEEVPAGTTVYFKSGFGYYLTWYSGSSGTIDVEIAVEVSTDMVNWEFVGEDLDSFDLTGPEIRTGSVRVGYTFDTPGEYFVRSTLTTRVSPASSPAPVEKTDVVLTTITVIANDDGGGGGGPGWWWR